MISYERPKGGERMKLPGRTLRGYAGCVKYKDQKGSQCDLQVGKTVVII